MRTLSLGGAASNGERVEREETTPLRNAE